MLFFHRVTGLLFALTAGIWSLGNCEAQQTRPQQTSPKPLTPFAEKREISHQSILSQPTSQFAHRTNSKASSRGNGISVVRELNLPLKKHFTYSQIAVMTADAAILTIIDEGNVYDPAHWLVKLPLDGSPAKLVHEFERSDDDGTNPVSLFVSASGKIFGTLEHGPHNEGGVFSLDARGENYRFLGEFPRPRGESGIGSPMLWTRGPAERLYGRISQTPSTSLLFYVNDDGSFEIKPHPEPYQQYPYMHSMSAESDGKYVYATASQELVRMNPDFTNWTTLHKFSGRQHPVAGPISGPGGLLYGLFRDRDDSTILYSINPDGTDYRVIRQFEFPVHSLVPGPQSAFYALQDLRTTDSMGRAIEGCPNALLKIPVDGSPVQTLQVFAQKGGTNVTLGPLLVDGNSLYGRTTSGGQSGRGVLFRYQLPDDSIQQPPHATTAFMTGTPSDAAPEKKALPWSNPEEAEYFVFIDNELWDLRSLSKVLTWPHAYQYSPSRPRLVRGAADTLVDIHQDDREGTLFSLWSLDGSEYRSSSLWHDDSTRNTRSHWLAADFMPDDFRRAIYIDQGDLWRATVDWNAKKLIDKQQVTKLGLLSSEKTRMLHWYGNTAWLWGGFDKDKPVIRVNLRTGAVTEMSSLGVFSPSDRKERTQSSPNGDLLYRAADGMVYVYDIPKNSYKSFPNYRIHRVVQPAVNDFTQGKTWNWISDRQLQGMSSDPGKPNLIDWNLGKVVNLAPKSSPTTGYYFVDVLPGGKYIDVAEERSVRGRSIPADELPRSLIEIATAKTVALPINRGTPSRWISDSELLYVKSEGGLSQVGTWIYDLTTDKHSRLMGQQLNLTPQIFIWNPTTRIACGTVSPDSSLVAIHLKKGEPATVNAVGDKKLSGGNPLRRIDTRELDLGLDGMSDPWASQEAYEAGDPQLSGELIGIDLVRKQVENESPDIRAYAERAYQSASREGQFQAHTYDPVKLTMKLVEAYRKTPVDPDDNPLAPLLKSSSGLDIRDCIDRERLEKYFYDRAINQLFLQQRVNGDEAKLKAVSEAIAKKGVELVVKTHPRSGMAGLDQFYDAAIKMVVWKRM